MSEPLYMYNDYDVIIEIDTTSKNMFEVNKVLTRSCNDNTFIIDTDTVLSMIYPRHVPQTLTDNKNVYQYQMNDFKGKRALYLDLSL